MGGVPTASEAIREEGDASIRPPLPGCWIRGMDARRDERVVPRGKPEGSEQPPRSRCEEERRPPCLSLPWKGRTSGISQAFLFPFGLRFWLGFFEFFCNEKERIPGWDQAPPEPGGRRDILHHGHGWGWMEGPYPLHHPPPAWLQRLRCATLIRLPLLGQKGEENP